MGRIALLVTAATAAVALASCGGDDDDGGSAATGGPASIIEPTAIEQAPATGAAASTLATNTTVASTTVAATEEPDDDNPTPASIAQRISDAGLGCDDFALPDPNETSATFIPEPDGEKGECTISGYPVEITVYTDDDAVEMAAAQVETVLPQFLVAFGITEFQFVQAGPDDRVVVALGFPENSFEFTAEQRDLTSQIADILDGEVVTVET
jgi:hypothetical protein